MTQAIRSLRSQIRKQRRKVSIFEQRQAEIACFKKLIQHPSYQNAKNIGIYLDAFGEIRTKKIIEWSLKIKKNIYLPKICPMNQKLIWIKINLLQYQNKRFRRHHFGMYEPYQSRGLCVSQLDLLVMPLVACDLHGNRLGMGGGFYDRTLAQTPHKPFRLGLAHNFQLLHQPLKQQLWDQPLHTLLCPSKGLNFGI